MMMRKLVVGLVCGAMLVLAQKQPKPKSQKELDALMAIQNAQDPDSRIAAVENLITKFADTEFKTMALTIAMSSAQQKNDFEKTIIYAERTLEADPKNYNAMLAIAGELARRTREFDLDKEDKLNRAEKLAREAQEVLKTAESPRPDITAEQWAGYKKDLEAQAHEVLGLSAMVRKKYDVAVQEFKTSTEVASQQDPATFARLAQAYREGGKHDDAIATADKVLAMPNLNPAVKQYAEQQKALATKAKGGAK